MVLQSPGQGDSAADTGHAEPARTHDECPLACRIPPPAAASRAVARSLPASECRRDWPRDRVGDLENPATKWPQDTPDSDTPWLFLSPGPPDTKTQSITASSPPAMPVCDLEHVLRMLTKDPCSLSPFVSRSLSPHVSPCFSRSSPSP